SVIRAQDGRVSSAVADAKVPSLKDRDISDSAFAEIVGDGQAMHSGADDNHIITVFHKKLSTSLNSALFTFHFFFRRQTETTNMKPFPGGQHAFPDVFDIVPGNQDQVAHASHEVIPQHHRPHSSNRRS